MVVGSQDPREREAEANGLPIQKQQQVVRMLDAIGAHADVDTAAVIRSFALKLPEASLAKVLESLLGASPRNRAAYAVAGLKSELEERAPFVGPEPS